MGKESNRMTSGNATYPGSQVLVLNILCFISIFEAIGSFEIVWNEKKILNLYIQVGDEKL